MIEFVTLLLGLATGGQTVELSVSEQVALVEVRLDGEFAGGLTGPPWLLDCDFGDELAPHELVATAFDAERRELQTIRQWVNLPRDRAEARLALDWVAGDGVAGDGVIGVPTTARLIWTALDHQSRPEVTVTFDGKPLPPGDLEAIVLPPHDLRSLHFLRADVRFSDADHAHAELVFGGTYGEEVSTELTAVALETKKRPPTPEKMAGWLRKGDQPLEVVAVDRGPVNLVVVRERSEATLDGLNQVFYDYQKALVEPGRVSLRMPPQPGPVTPPSVLGEDGRVRFAFPTTGRERVRVGQGAAPLAVEQVPVSRDVSDRGRLFDVLTHHFWSAEEAPAARQELADAVAIAGVVAAAGDRRRAVLLIRSGAAEDTSRFSPREVRGYLRRLGVPLFVWSLAASEEPDGATSAWGEERDVSTYKRMNKALDDLRKALKPQVVVWVGGAHLSHQVELTAKASGLRPVD